MPPRRGLPVLFWLFAGLYFTALVCANSAEQVDAAKIAKVKAAYIYNFAKFVHWPEKAFASAESPFVIGVFGANPFGHSLDDAVRGRTTGHRRFSILQINPQDRNWRADVQSCHILYVAYAESSRIDALLETVESLPVLLVGEGEQFARYHGSIGFSLEDGRVVLYINRTAADSAGLKVGADLLGIARLVESTGSMGRRRN